MERGWRPPRCPRPRTAAGPASQSVLSWLSPLPCLRFASFSFFPGRENIINECFIFSVLSTSGDLL